MEANRPTRVCIIGMHRSNTSMLAHMLSELGVDVGPHDRLIDSEDVSGTALELRAANSDNPEGYWEDAAFVEINDMILTQYGGSILEPPVLPKGWAASKELKTVRGKAKALIASRDEHSPWLWKDPRTSLTIRFWRDLIPDLKIIHCVRSPVEVALSLAKRGIAGTSYDRGLELWLHYCQSAAKGSAGESTMVSHCEAVFYDAKAELSRIAQFLGLNPAEEDLARAAAVFNPKLRRAVDLSDRAAKLPRRVKTLYSQLQEQAGPVYAASMGKAASPRSMEELEVLVREFQDSLVIKSALEEDRIKSISWLTKQVDNHREELAKAVEYIRSLETRLAEIQEEMAGIHRLAYVEEQLTQHEKELAGAVGYIRDLEGRIEALTQSEHQLFLENQSLHAEVQRLEPYAPAAQPGESTEGRHPAGRGLTSGGFLLRLRRGIKRRL